MREVAVESIEQLVEGLHESVGRVHAVEVLTLWEGFESFCRETLGVEPLTLVRAYRLQREDPAAEVVAAYRTASPDEAEAKRWAEQWTRSWDRRFKG